MKNKGLVHIYTGEGKGKTSAALGLCMRAHGANLNILFSQFLKGQATSELNSLFALGIPVIRTEEVKKFVFFMSDEEKKECKNSHTVCYNKVKDFILNGTFDLVVLDEIIPAIELELIALNDVLTLIQSRPYHTELILTGRNAPSKLIELADYVCDIKSIKHPYEAGIIARKGIEY